MSNLKYWVYGLLILVISPMLLADTILTSNMTPEFNLGQHSDILRDPQNEWSLHTILQNPSQQQFVPNSQNNINLGFTQDTIWVRMTIFNNLSHHVTKLLEIPYPILDNVTFYEPTSDGYIVKEMGDHVSFSEREITYRNLLITLHLQPQQTKIFYLQVKTASAMNIPLILWDKSAFNEHRNTQNIWLSFYTSLLIVMFFYNLLLFISTGDRGYFHYVIFIASWLFFVLGINGISFQLFWPNNIWWANQSLPFFISLATLSMALFSRNFLCTGETGNRRAKLLFQILLITNTIATSIVLFIGYTLSIKIVTILASISSIICIIFGLKCWLNGYLPARYYVVAWSILFFGIISFALKTLGLFPDNEFTHWSLHIGASIQMMLFSLALANRINTTRQFALQAHEEKLAAQKLAIENMREAKELATQASETKTTFLVNMSHQFKTPLNHIIGYCELINEELTAEGFAYLSKDLEKVKEAGHYLNHLVAEILELARIDNNMSQLQFESFDLAELLQHAINRKEKQYKHHHNKVEIRLYQPQIEIVSDKFKLMSLFGHILDNSFQYTKQGNLIISIIEDERPGWLCWSVEDNGLGIARDIMPMVQSILSQSSQSSLLTTEGNIGLGLLISKRLVELLGGFINVNSEPNRGTIFTIRLPNGHEVITDRI